MQRKRIATAPNGASGWRIQGMQIGAEMDLIRLTSFGTFPRGEGGRMRIQTNFFLTQPVLHGKIAYPVRVL